MFSLFFGFLIFIYFIQTRRCTLNLTAMKKIISSLTLLFFVVKSFSQQPSKQVFSKSELLQKSKTQKTTAWVLLGTGFGIALVGGIVHASSGNESNQEQDDGYDFGFDFDFTGPLIAAGGGIVALSSIPFFISSSKNAKKAATISISSRRIPLPQQNNIVLTSQPTVSLRIRF